MDIRAKFEAIHLITDMFKESNKDYVHNMNLINMKRNLRQELKDKNSDRIIKEYGVDGHVVLQEFPNDVSTETEAEKYFKDTWYRACRPSMYDCTGQAFTSWYKIFQRRGKWIVYHKVNFDV